MCSTYSEKHLLTLFYLDFYIYIYKRDSNNIPQYTDRLDYLQYVHPRNTSFHSFFIHQYFPHFLSSPIIYYYLISTSVRSKLTVEYGGTITFPTSFKPLDP